MTDTNLPTNTTFDPERYSSRYKNALAIVFVLFLALLTATIWIVILSSNRRENLEEKYQQTIAAVMAQNATQRTTLAGTPPPTLLPVAGRYAFAIQEDSPSFSADADCTGQVVSGTVLNQAGEPIDGYQTLIWGDYTPPQTAYTGSVSEQPTGNWRLNLPSVIDRRVWVQLSDGAHYVSAPVAFIFEQGNCAQNRVTITFVQTAPDETG